MCRHFKKEVENMAEFLAVLKEALLAAAELDAEQKHQEAAAVLERALRSGGPWDGKEPEEAVAVETARAIQACSRERERQELRHLRLQAYLTQ
jgi:hypothetical protein